MKITLHTIPIREVVAGYDDQDEDGVFGYHGKLNIRPPFQRNFVYEEKDEIAVINSIMRDFPLNVMYWVKNYDGTFDLLDGQQRTLSICKFYSNEYFVPVDGYTKNFDSLSDQQREKFLNYKLQIYICEDATDQEKLDWFRIINIAGKKLTEQELLNAVYAGPWISDAKLRFSKTNCVAYKLGKDYMDGAPINQKYLETVLKWISKGDIEKYMAEHKNDKNADIEWQFYKTVINWVQTLFTVRRREMKGVEWGDLYNRFKELTVSASDIEKRLKDLFEDDDVTNAKGIYDYVLSGDERKLNIRAFTKKMRRKAYERQNGICTKCGKHFELEEMEADHITPWSQGGETRFENCQMLCKDCNRTKSDK